MEHHAKIYRKKKKQEMDYWIDMPDRFVDDLDDEQKKEHLNQHFIFTKANGVALLKMFLTTKVAKNEQDLNVLCDPCFNESHNVGDGKKDLRQGIESEKARLEKKFQNKYFTTDELKFDEHKHYSIRRAMLQKE